MHCYTLQHTVTHTHPRRCKTSLVSKRGTVCPEVAGSIPTKLQKELKSTFEHIELPVKLLDYFLRSNKSNVNRSQHDPITHTYTRITHETLPSHTQTSRITLYNHAQYTIITETNTL